MTKHIRSAAVLFVLVLAFWFSFFETPLFSLEMGRKSAFILVCLSFWATGIIPEYLTALFFFTGAMLLGVAPPDIIFSGFSSGAFWLILGGLVLGIAINVTGLGNRIAAKATERLNRSYTQLITGLVFSSTFSGLLMPSALGRVVLLVPIAVSVAEQFGLQKGRKGYTGVVSAVVLGCFLPGFSILPANVPNMVLAGLSENLHAYSPLYGEYLLLHFPILGILKSVLITVTILILFPDSIQAGTKAPYEEKDGMGPREKILALVLVLMLSLWISDFLHHIAPAWVAMTGACIVLLPYVNIVTPQLFQQKINLGSLFYIAGILGLGQVINSSGLGTVMAKQCIDILHFRPDQPFVNFMSLSLLSMVTGSFTTQPGVPAVLTPFAGELARVTELPVKSVVMSQVVGFSQPLFPYQVPPLLIGMQMAGVYLLEGFKLCFILSLAAVLLLIPLDYLWWQFLGWL